MKSSARVHYAGRELDWQLGGPKIGELVGLAW